MKIIRPLSFKLRKLSRLTFKKLATYTSITAIFALAILTAQNLLAGPAITSAATTSESCFVFDDSQGIITWYRYYEGGVAEAPECPDVVQYT